MSPPIPSQSGPQPSPLVSPPPPLVSPPPPTSSLASRVFSDVATIFGVQVKLGLKNHTVTPFWMQGGGSRDAATMIEHLVGDAVLRERENPGATSTPGPLEAEVKKFYDVDNPHTTDPNKARDFLSKLTIHKDRMVIQGAGAGGADLTVKFPDAQKMKTDWKAVLPTLDTAFSEAERTTGNQSYKTAKRVNTVAARLFESRPADGGAAAASSSLASTTGHTGSTLSSKSGSASTKGSTTSSSAPEVSSSSDEQEVAALRKELQGLDDHKLSQRVAEERKKFAPADVKNRPTPTSKQAATLRALADEVAARRKTVAELEREKVKRQVLLLEAHWLEDFKTPPSNAGGTLSTTSTSSPPTTTKKRPPPPPKKKTPTQSATTASQTPSSTSGETLSPTNTGLTQPTPNSTRQPPPPEETTTPSATTASQTSPTTTLTPPAAPPSPPAAPPPPPAAAAAAPPPADAAAVERKVLFTALHGRRKAIKGKGPNDENEAVAASPGSPASPASQQASVAQPDFKPPPAAAPPPPPPPAAAAAATTNARASLLGQIRTGVKLKPSNSPPGTGINPPKEPPQKNSDAGSTKSLPRLRGFTQHKQDQLDSLAEQRNPDPDDKWDSPPPTPPQS